MGRPRVVGVDLPVMPPVKPMLAKAVHVMPRDPGLIYEPNTPEGIADGVRRLFDALPERAATRAYAEPFSWDETTAGQLAIFRRAAGITPDGTGAPPRQ